MGRGAIEHRVASRRLVLVHRGVYAVGHLPRTRETAWMAAVLACGSNAVLSHRSAAALWGLRRWAPVRPEVTTPTQRCRPRIVVHVRRTTAEERDVHDGIPVTTPSRTIVDLAADMDAEEIERVVREADFQRRLDVGAIRASLAGRPTPVLEELLARRSPTASRHEDRFLRLCRQYDLPMPLTQQRVGGRTVDFLWPAAHVVVEVDSWDAHRTYSAFQDDRSATNGMILAGYVVLRFTDWEIRRRPARVAATVRRALDRHLGRPSLARP